MLRLQLHQVSMGQCDKLYVFLKDSMHHFTIPDRTEDWIVYHAMEDPDKGWDNRTARIERFSWNSLNGSPTFPRPSGFPTTIQLPSGE